MGGGCAGVGSGGGNVCGEGGVGADADGGAGCSGAGGVGSGTVGAPCVGAGFGIVGGCGDGWRCDWSCPGSSMTVTDGGDKASGGVGVLGAARNSMSTSRCSNTETASVQRNLRRSRRRSIVPLIGRLATARSRVD